MPKQVVMTAQLTCSFGTSPSNLQVLPTNRTQVANQWAANIMDFQPMVNIMPFGMCLSVANPQVAAATSAALGVLTPQPCIPMTMAPWTPGAPQTQIASMQALDDTCQCLCLWLGQITVTSPGQTIKEID